MKLFVQDNSENLRVYAYVWSNPNDPDLYAEWDFEVFSKQIICMIVPTSLGMK